ncbi:hypothetical protein DV096_17565 [Bradymonadaceae bacterium TMQ3]|nr:hypothetical protein DV096_17565 [Bradymonadaceae bacterium TMQ3]TXC69514.1 hypothetical protein FRC91_18145 [Bradymonadales bacterium TMQ1]
MKRLTPWNLPLSGILVLALAACGGDNAETPDLLECGPGTELSGGACVLAENTCGAGLTLNDNDQCVPTDELCGDETVYDTESGTCVGPEEIVCGEGTIEIDGRCLVDNPLTCGEDTVLANGQCELTEEVCGEGTEFADAGCALLGETVCADRTVFDVALGKCVDLGNVVCSDDTFEVENRCISVDTVADNLASSADVVYAEGGDNALTIPALESSLVFAGTIEADDAGQHEFTLTAEVGDWFELTVFTRGLPSPMAIITNDDGYDRATSSGISNVAQRTFALPADGDYTVTIANALNELNGTANSGDGTWAYVAQINRIEAPAPKPWPGIEAVASGDLSELTENLYQVEFPADFNLAMSVDMLGADAQAVVDQWASLSEFTESFDLEEGDTFVPERPASGQPIFLLFDTERQTGPSTAFAISTQRAVDVDVDDTYEYEVVAQPGQMLRLGYTSSSPSSFSTIFTISKNGEELAYYEDVYPVDHPTTYYDTEMYFFAAEGGTYTIAMTNDNWAATIYDFVPVNIFIDPTPINVTGGGNFSFSREERLDSGDLEFYRIDVAAPVGFEGVLRTGGIIYDEVEEEWIEDDNNPGDGNPNGAILGSDNLVSHQFFGTGTFELLDFTLLTPGSYIFVVSGLGALPQGYTFELTSTERQALVPEEIISETFTLDTYDLIRGSAEFAEGESATIRIYNPDDVVIFEAEASGEYKFLELAPGPGDYRVELTNETEDAILRPTYEFEGVTDADFFEASLGSLDLGTTGAYAAGDRNYYLFRVRDAMLISMTFSVAQGEAISTKVFSRASRNTLREQVGNLINFEDLYASNDLIIVEVVANSVLADGYSFDLDFDEVTGVPSVNVSETADAPIVDNTPSGTVRNLTTLGCVVVSEITVDVDISHNWIGDVVMELTSPSGTTVRLHSRSGGSSDDIVGNYPGDITPNESLDAFIGESGQGDWTLYVADVSGGIAGTLNSWGINLTCGT